MGDEQIQQLAHEIANQTAFHNWEYWLALLAVAFIGAVSSFFGAYVKKRAEHVATKAGLDEILRQLALTTRTTEGIRAVVSLGEWSERERRTLRRMKLEEVLMAAHRAKDWIDAERDRLIWSSGAAQSVSPLPTAVALGKLYVPELADPLGAYNDAVNDFLVLLGDVARSMSIAKHDALQTGELAPKKAASVVRRTRSQEVLKANRTVNDALVALDVAAAKLMTEVIAVPPAS